MSVFLFTSGVCRDFLAVSGALRDRARMFTKSTRI